MRICFDLDGTLCTAVGHGDYKAARPIEARIRRVRELHAAGHYIIIDTARGSETEQHWTVFTRDQLDGWGVPFHELHVGRKPFAHVYVDDRAVTDTEFFKGEPCTKTIIETP